MGFTPDTATSEEDGRIIERTILSLLLLDTFIATYPTCLRDDGLDSGRDHRKKLHLNTVSKFLLLAYNQWINVMRQFVIECCSTTFSVDALSVDSNEVYRD